MKVLEIPLHCGQVWRYVTYVPPVYTKSTEAQVDLAEPVCTLEERAEIDICNGPVQPLGFFYFYSPQIECYY